MQQTGLNIMAIAVFSITIFSLIGPIFHISPVIPALTTVGLLGLVGLDNLWQNRGINLLLDSLSSSEEKERVLHHEAGHFLVAYILGIPVQDYTLSAWEAIKKGQPGFGGVNFATETLAATNFNKLEQQVMLERFFTVWMAGIAAEKIIYGNARGGKDDQEKFVTALATAGLNPQTASQKQRWALLQAVNLINQHLPSYQALVTAMKNRATVTQCYQEMEKVRSLETP